MARRVAATRASTAVEKIYCGSLTDNAGVVRLDGVTGATPTSGSPSILGDGGVRCLAPKDVHAMNWVLPEVLVSRSTGGGGDALQNGRALWCGCRQCAL